MRRVARAFGPGHVTGIFRPAASGRDPRSMGSVGAGLVLDVGARAEVVWEEGRGRAVDVRDPDGNPLPITNEALAHLLPARRGALRGRIDFDLPVGAGFGMSAAGTLAAALAAASVLGAPRSRAVESSHLADLLGRGGLGGVAAILGGGLEVRRRAGVPPFGDAVHLRWNAGTLFLVRVGRAIPSPRILGDARWLERIERAAGGLDRLLAHPAIGAFLDLSEEFTDHLRLAPPPFDRTVRSLRSTGSRVAQAMFGRTLFVVAPSARARRRLLRALIDRRLPAVEVGVGRAGARLLPPRSADVSRSTRRP